MTLMLLAGMVQEAEHAGPVSPFEVNFGLFIWTWAVFLLLLWLLKKFAFPAILRVTEEREQAIQRQLGEAEKANNEAKSLLEENRRQLAQARTEAQTFIAEAKTAAEKERATALEKGRHEETAGRQGKTPAMSRRRCWTGRGGTSVKSGRRPSPICGGKRLICRWRLRRVWWNSGSMPTPIAPSFRATSTPWGRAIEAGHHRPELR